MRSKHACRVDPRRHVQLTVRTAHPTEKIKSELDGTAFLEMWVHVNKGQYFSRSMNDTVSGTTGWKKISTPFIFQKGQKPDKVTLNIVINGKGTVWVDDIVLTREPL